MVTSALLSPSSCMCEDVHFMTDVHFVSCSLTADRYQLYVYVIILAKAVNGL